MAGPIVVLDFGSQTGHLVARRVRDLGHASEVAPCTTPAEKLKHCAGIVLSGGAASVYDEDSPKADPAIFDLGVPILGLCYGLHWVVQHFGGEVRRGEKREYGPVRVERTGNFFLFADCPKNWQVWMSHGDEAVRLPPDFWVLARSENCAHAAVFHKQRELALLQWHPEHKHTEYGREIIRRFCQWCDASPWSVANRLSTLRADIAEQVSNRNVIALVSGGVDSMVMFTLLNEVLGPDRVHGILVDNGLLRRGEVEQVQQTFAARDYRNFTVVDEQATFLNVLAGVYGPEEKRNLIGDMFMTVATREFARRGFSPDGTHTLLAQGTIYPDTVETGPIKTHHNRSGLALAWIRKGLIIEPLKDFYKDEVRQLGRELGLPEEIVNRHPYPGPGLAVRILCAAKPSWPEKFPTLVHTLSHPLPVKSVGAKGDGRSYEHALALFSPDLYQLPDHFWQVAADIPNTVPGYNRVIFCVSHTQLPNFSFTAGTISADRLWRLRQPDAIVTKEMRRAGLYDKIWQCPVVLLPFGARVGTESIVIRPVESEDAMTATPYRLPPEFLESVTRQLLAISGISMVFYDLTTKPPGTIEWE